MNSSKLLKRAYHILLLLFLLPMAGMGQYQLFGDAASLGGECYRLTLAQNSQLGAAWKQNSIDLSQPFDYRFTVFLGTSNGGADGMNFVIKNSITPAMGTGGGGMGYETLNNSVAIEFDTWQNANIGDPVNDHIAIVSNGSNDHGTINNLAGPIQASPLTTNIEDGADHPMRVTWDPVTTELKVWFDCSLRLTYTGNIVNDIFAGNPVVFFGFTASTGGANNLQSFCEVSLNGIQNTPLTDTTICFGDTANFNAGPSSLNYDWGPAAGLTSTNTNSTSAVPLTTTTYIVTISDDCDSIFDTVTVNVNPQPQWTGTITGPDSLCAGDTGIYTVQSQPFATTYNWTIPTGSTLLSGQGATTIALVAGNNPGNVCVNYSDTCATSPNLCKAVDYGAPPVPAFAGNDTLICSTTMILQATAPTIGNGLWTVLQGGGTVAAPTVAGSQVSNLSAGVNLLEFSVSSGACPTTLDTVEVTAVPAPIPDFSFSDVCLNEVLQLGDQSVATLLPITLWQWDIGNDGTQDYAVQNPDHIFSQFGPTSVKLTILDSIGCAASVTHNISVNPLPDAGFDFDDVCIGEQALFTDTSSIPTGQLASFSWDLGDNTTVANQSQVTHTYQQEGTYPVTLTVVSAEGCSTVVAETFRVFHIPAASFTAPMGCSNVPAIFQDQSTVLSGAINQWDWDFGDGGASVLANPTHQYTTEQPFQVSLKVTTSAGCSDSSSIIINRYPSPVPDFLTRSLCRGDTLAFQNVTTLGAPATITSWHWTLDLSQATSTTFEPIHVYDISGNHPVKLVAVTSDNCTDSIVKPVFVTEQPQASFYTDTACANSPTQFVSTSTVVDGRIDKHTWIFGDGNVGEDNGIVSHTYETGGTKTVLLAVQSDQGCVDSVEVSVPVYHLPVPSIVVTPDSGCSPLQVQFEDGSTVSDPGIEFSSSWRFGNGQGSEDSETTQLFVNDGEFPRSFSVELITTTSEGCVNQVSNDEAILVFPKPNASFTLSDTVIRSIAPVIRVQNTSIGDLIWSWSFGDGTEEFQNQESTHTYTDVGRFPVKLWVENQYSCPDSLIRLVRVVPQLALYIPNAFTPDGDGLNDVFKVKGVDFASFEMKLYNRWGEVFFETTNITDGWNGNMGNGKLAPVGNYTYRVIVMDEKENTEVYSGVFSLIR